MNPVRDRRAGEIFLAAASMEEPRRGAFIAAESGGDAALRTEVESLLRADLRNGDVFLNEPALGPGFHVMSGATAGDEPPSDPACPGRIGPYHTLELLGESDDAVVWLAEQREPVERRVAVKILRSAAARREVQRRFELERRAVALMEHPNVARLFDAGTTPDGRAYFAMEHVAGTPITTAAAGLDVRERLRLFVQACLGVEHAHQRGIIHRDLKPSNLMVAQGQERSVKVIDFGVAAAIRAGLEERTGLTLQGQVLGTPGYLAPERLTSAVQATGTLVDVYSLGAVLFEVLCGRPAFELSGRGTVGALAAIMTESPTRLSGVDRSLRGDPEAIVTRAMERDPSERYQSVADLRRDVEQYLAGRPISARRHGPLYVSRRFVSRHRLLSGVVAAAALIAGASLWRARAADQAKYDLATELAGSVFQQTVRMARTIGERAQRRPLLEQLESESARLGQLDPDDVRILRVRAAITGALGDVAEEDNDMSTAGARIAEALRLRTRVVELRPRDLEAQMDLSIATVRYGDVLKNTGDAPAALVYYERAIALDRAIVSQAPSNARAVSNLAWSCLRLGSRAIENGEDELAAGLLDESLVLMRALQWLRGNVDDARGLAEVHGQMGHLARRRNDTAAQVGFFEAARNTAMTARDMAPENRLAGHQSLRSRIDCLWVMGRDEADRSAPDAWPLLFEETCRFVRRDPADRDSRVLMLIAFQRAMKIAEQECDEALADRLAAMIDAELEAMLRDRPADPELLHQQQASRDLLDQVRSSVQAADVQVDDPSDTDTTSPQP